MVALLLLLAVMFAVPFVGATAIACVIAHAVFRPRSMHWSQWGTTR